MTKQLLLAFLLIATFLLVGCNETAETEEITPAPTRNPMPTITAEPTRTVTSGTQNLTLEPIEEPTVIPQKSTPPLPTKEPTPIIEPEPTNTPDPVVESAPYQVTQYVVKGDYEMPLSESRYVIVHYACLSIMNINIKTGTFKIWFSGVAPLKELEDYPFKENFFVKSIEPYQTIEVRCPTNDHPGTWTYQIVAMFED